MTNTKSEILALLKRNGGLSVGELAEALRLAPATIRQHLTHLERDSLVHPEREANGNGRPHYRYRLTAKAHAQAFPGRSDRMVELLLREVGLLVGDEIDGLSTAQKTRLVLQRLAERLADEYAPLLKGWPLQERVAFVTEVMHADGGFAEFAAHERGYEIRDYNCLFHRLLGDQEQGEVCEWHRTFLTRTLGTEVRITPCPEAGESCCRYLIEKVAAREHAVAAT